MHASLADILADVAANSIEAGAQHIRVSVVEKDGRIVFEIVDDGKGMDAATCARAFDPFYTEPGKHAQRKIGMGLPLVKQTCDMCGGSVTLTSAKGKGTTLICTFQADNIDLPPMGDLVGALVSLFGFSGDFEMVFTHQRGSESYEIARLDLRDAVGGFDTVDGLALAREYLASQEEALAGGE